MERASRFIVAQQCGQKDAQMFEDVMKVVASYLEQSGDVTFLSDGDRRYSNIRFNLCAKAIKIGQPGRPLKTLPERFKVRLNNKGNQSSKPGHKHPKYQAPYREHPNTLQTLESSDIHANHLEAYHAALRRRNNAFRRRSNTYTKLKTALQRTLDVHHIIHNFVRLHWTTGEVPAMALGILTVPLSLEDILTQRFA